MSGDPPADEADPVELSEEESTVLMLLDGAGSLDELAAASGVERGRLRGVLDRLHALGLLEGAPSHVTGPPPPPAVEADAEPSELGDADVIVDAEPEEAPPAEAFEEGSAAADLARVDAAPLPDAPATGEPEADSPADEPARALVEADHRKRFETTLRPLEPDARAHLAATSADGPTLLALCFDPDLAVIRALFDNPNVGLEHARLAAFHHRSMTGLDVLASRGDLLRDAQVQRRLLRNPMLGETLLRRLLKPRRLLEVYKLTNDRDVPERSRSSARAMFRQKFTTAEPEERCEIIWSTEGRVLVMLTGCTFDSRTTAMLCGRPVLSIQLIQSLARFPATPPMILTHLLKQPLVKRQAHLRNMLLQHPNAPSDVKRKG
jgi:hypothetical protein